MSFFSFAKRRNQSPEWQRGGFRSEPDPALRSHCVAPLRRAQQRAQARERIITARGEKGSGVFFDAVLFPFVFFVLFVVKSGFNHEEREGKKTIERETAHHLFRIVGVKRRRGSGGGDQGSGVGGRVKTSP
jgi:hypothetical protein